MLACCHCVHMRARLDAPGYIKQRYFIDTWPNLRPGDVTFHSGWTLHSSYPNTKSKSSGAVREAITVSYVPESVRKLPTAKFEKQYAVDDRLNGVRTQLDDMDLGPGSPVPTSVLPRVWPR